LEAGARAPKMAALIQKSKVAVTHSKNDRRSPCQPRGGAKVRRRWLAIMVVLGKLSSENISSVWMHFLSRWWRLLSRRILALKCPSACHIPLDEGGQKEGIIDCLFYDFLCIRDTHLNDTEFKVHVWTEKGRLAVFLSSIPTVENVFHVNGYRETKSAVLGRLGLQERPFGDCHVYIPIDNFEETQEQSFRDGIAW